MARERTDKRLSISMPASDYDRLLSIQERIEAVSASDAIRLALRRFERELDADAAKAERRARASA